jgi:hypothetical protein
MGFGNGAHKISAESDWGSIGETIGATLGSDEARRTLPWLSVVWIEASILILRQYENTSVLGYDTGFDHSEFAYNCKKEKKIPKMKFLSVWA